MLNIVDKAGVVVDMNTGMIRLPIVIDDEMNGMVQKILSRPVVNEDTMAWDLLSRSELGMQFICCKHTFQHCREGFWPKSFTR